MLRRPSFDFFGTSRRLGAESGFGARMEEGIEPHEEPSKDVLLLKLNEEFASEERPVAEGMAVTNRTEGIADGECCAFEDVLFVSPRGRDSIVSELCILWF